MAERRNLTIMNAVRAVLDHAGLPFLLWGEIARTMVYLLNRNSTARLQVQHITPGEAYTTVKPDISHYRMIGCDASSIFKDRKGQKKLSPRGIKCKLLGYEGTNQYRLWNPIFKRIVTARNVDFDESSMLNKPHKAYHWDNSSDFGFHALEARG